MKVNGTLINYFFHCKRQCYLHANRLNLEDNSENVKIGKAFHEEKHSKSKNTEISIDNIRIDKLTNEYLTEIKKSDADIQACKWQLLFYLKILREKGINRKGRLVFIETKNRDKKTHILKIDSVILKELDQIIKEIEVLTTQDKIPKVLNKVKCKKCAYYEYCYI